MTPEAIEQKAIYCAELAQERDREQAKLQEIEDMVTVEILGQRDSSGKPVYSNETSRAIAIRQMCRDLGGWRQCKDKLEALELDLAMHRAELERLRGEFSAWKLEHRRLTAEMETAN